MKQIPDTARRHHVNRASPIRRPALPRAQPIRNFAGVFGAAPRSAHASKAGAEKPRSEKPRSDSSRADKGPTGQGKRKKPMSAPAATVARGVNAGYRVIEEYLRQGQEFARSLWPASGGGARAAHNGGTAEAPMNMTERLVRSASDLAALFSEFLQTFSLPGILPAPGSTPIPDFGIGRNTGAAPPATEAGRTGARRTGSADAAGVSAPAADAATTISIDLRSRRRTTVTAFVQPGGWSGGLVVHDLRPPNGAGQAGSARLTGVTATAADRRVVIAVDIPDTLAAGTYSGLIVDADSNLPRGTLSIQVFAGPTPRPARKAARK
jgi:hypothetical protein